MGYNPIYLPHAPGAVGGTYAQYALSSASTVFSLPEHVSFDQGAAINVPYKTAYIALFRVCLA